MKKVTLVLSVILLVGCSSSSNFIDYQFNEPEEHSSYTQDQGYVAKVNDSPFTINSASQKLTQLDLQKYAPSYHPSPFIHYRWYLSSQ